MLKFFANITLSQSLIVSVASILMFLFGVYGQIVSLDKIASCPYLIMSIISSIIIFVNRNKIKLFSPLFIFFVSLFFAIICSAFYYFSTNIDIMHYPVLLSGTIIDEINLLYLIFFFFMIIPIIFISIYSIKLKKYKILKINKKDLNSLFLFYLMVIIILLTLLFVMTKVTPITAILNPIAFRTAINTGGIVFIKIIFNFVFYFMAILMFVDILKEENIIKPYSKLIFFTLLLYYSVACGSRGFIVNFIYYLIMSFTFFKKIKIKDCFIGLIILVVLLIFNSIYLRYRNIKSDLAKGHINTQITNPTSNLSFIDDVLKRNDSFVNSIVFFKWYKKNTNSLVTDNPNHLFEEIQYHILSYLPRKLKNKIFDGDDLGQNFTIMMTNKIYNNAYNLYGVSYDIGGIASCYWNFGLIGVCAGGFFFGGLVCLLQKLFDIYYKNEVFLAFYLLIFYPLLDSFLKVGYINSPLTINLMLNLLILFVVSIIAYKNFRVKL